jgi:Peptidase family M28/PA domain
MKKGYRPLAVVLSAVAVTVAAGPASAAPPTNTQPLQDAVKVGNGASGIRQHLRQFQVIADANNGTRSTGSSGHAASLAYVKSKLEATGYYNVSTQPFSAQVFNVLAPPTLSATPAASPAWVADQDFEYMEFSGSGALTNAPIAVIDFAEPTTTASTSNGGCEDADFPAGATSLAGKVAVIQRGTCDFGLKVVNAQAHGAAAVIIFNEGTIGAPDRQGLINGTLGGYDIKVPVLGATYAAGRYLVDHPAATVSLSASTRTDNLQTSNLIAETKTGRTDRTVIVGAHLDSVPEGPGINDDGSGSATDLEVALQMAKLGIKPVNQVRFIWFSGEEQGAAWLDVLRRWADEEAGRRHLGDAGLRHARFAELRQAHLRRGRLRVRGLGSQRLGHRGEGLPGLLRRARVVYRADPVRRPFRLRRVHGGRDPGRRHLYRSGGAQDTVPAVQVGWCGRRRPRRAV